ncbi:hypothetical protein LMB21_09630, partial [Limosilactobacillus reuteri]|uniref:hypothetical protein n=1 Tax=Limosilactobacillus reuteri TaxID=1598 RepID=UPI001E57CF45
MAGTVYDQLITFNTYKQAPTIKNITSLFNGRVGDQGVRLATRWLQGEEGTEVKIAERGMFARAYMVVGNGKPDGLGGIMMADGADTVIVDGDKADVYDHGIAVLQLPKQMFPQDGYAKGYFALVDDLGNIWSSVDIWFKVQGGLPTMGLAAKYYVSRWEMEIDQARQKNEDFQREMRAAYNQQVTETQNALAKARGDLQDVATTAGNINAQIKAQDIVTRAEFKDGMDDIRKNTYGAISNVTNGAPKPIKDLATLQAKLPNGDTGFYVTSDTGLKYAFVDGAWQSFGVYQATAMPEEDKNNLDDLVKYRNKRNLVANNDWHTGDITNWYTIGNIDTEVQTGAYQGRNVLRIQNHGQSGDSWNGITSEPIPVIAGQPISEAVKA